MSFEATIHRAAISNKWKKKEEKKEKRLGYQHRKLRPPNYILSIRKVVVQTLQVSSV